MMADFKFVFWYDVLGAHTHVRLFVARAGNTRAKAGDFVMSNEEFAAFREISEKVGFEFHPASRVPLFSAREAGRKP
jgi:hypothetical protein